MNNQETFDRGSTDAMVWAKAFEEHKQRNNWTLDDIDEGLMVGWFANAMCAQLGCDLNQIEELANDANRKAHEAIGCTYATMCDLAMKGEDITKIEFPEIAEGVIKALGLDATDGEVNE